VALNDHGCSDEETILLEVHPLPQSQFELPIGSSCGSPVMVEAVNGSIGATAFQWSVNGVPAGQSADPELVFMGIGAHVVELIAGNDFGCTHASSATFTIHAEPEAAMKVAPASVCAGEEVWFTDHSLNALSVQWFPGDGSVHTGSGSHHYDTDGIKDVMLVAMGAGGCTDTLVMPSAVVVHPLPRSRFEHQVSNTLPNAITFQSVSEGALMHYWDLGDGSHSMEEGLLHMFDPQGGIFDVCLLVENEHSCMDSTCMEIVIPTGPVVQVPNAFTPNGDGLNDVFLPMVEISNGWSYSLEIFDRLGERIHLTRDRMAGWDGRINGRDGAAGVYVWRLQLGQGAEAREYTGHVSLVR
jgi:gliding motility-associated-like protein